MRRLPRPRAGCATCLRAERKAGELLAAMEKAKRGPDRDTGQRSQRTTSETVPTLRDLGISRDQSSRWQKPEWSRWSDREIARTCAVSHPFVISLRPKPPLSGNGYQIEPPRTVARNGTTYTMNTARIGGGNGSAPAAR